VPAIANLFKLQLLLLDGVDIAGFTARQLTVQFNPTDYSIDRTSKYAEVAIPGLDAPVLQWVRGDGDTINLQLFFDVTDSMEAGIALRDVRREFVAPLEQLMVRHPELHRPPRVAAYWGRQAVIRSAVAQSLSVTYNVFDAEGKPVRATARLGLRQHTTATRQILDPGNRSPDLDNTVTVREGDTLPSIAQRVYRDPTRWRDIAEANGIANPLALTAGRTLIAPRIA
jgi:hypothetical protein